VSSSDTAQLARLRAEIINAKDLPTMPVLLVRILAVVDGERSSVRDLVDVIQRDQALTARVLRLANSGFFGYARQVASLARAVMLLGFSTVRNLALGVKVWETLAVDRGLSLAHLWAHSAFVAAAARHIAQRTRTGEPEEVFTAGLLHDVGRVILTLRFADKYAAVCDGPPAELIERERAAFGFDHAQAGAWLAEAWELPVAIAETAERHHRPIAVRAPLTTPVIVGVANRLVHWTDLGGDGGVDARAERFLVDQQIPGLGVGIWQEIAAALHAQHDELREFFGASA
jgi:putative nucleotidyltransferase with HDIG domain